MRETEPKALARAGTRCCTVPAQENSLFGRIGELGRNGYCCSQILVMLALEDQRRTNWDVVRCVEGFRGGMGLSGGLCGALTGGVCLLGLYAGRGSFPEETHPLLDAMVQELVDWFDNSVGARHGGTRCADITNGFQQERIAVCGMIVAETYGTAKAILQSRGFDLTRPRHGSLPEEI